MDATERTDLLPAPILLVTGFLGSGKTTLINRWLRAPAGLRLGVLVNEFGQIGIDGGLLGPGDVLELSDGCVCCATGAELWESARDLRLRAGATHLLVETSGIAEPSVLVQQYEELPAALRAHFDLRGTLCLVDALQLADTIDRRAEARHQIAEADRLLLTKVDLCDGEQLSQVHQLLDRLSGSGERAALRPDATAYEVVQTLHWAMAPGGRRGRRAGAQVHVHEHGQLSAVSLAEAAPLLEAPLRRLLGELPGVVLRAKGFVRLAAPPRLCVLQLAGAQIELRAATDSEAQKAPAGSALVFIGEGLDEDWLRLRLSACRAS